MCYVCAAKRFVADCRGATSIFLALSLTGILGFAGLATDVGLWYVKKRAMQSPLRVGLSRWQTKKKSPRPAGAIALLAARTDK
jgi:Putative Flp pilus-assembly TadE/G-like